jgi:uncharacterized membrane protein HdeD (DUF308 family)
MKTSQLGGWLCLASGTIVLCAVIAGGLSIGDPETGFARHFLKVFLSIVSGIAGTVVTMTVAARLGGHDRVLPSVIGCLVGLIIAATLSIEAAWRFVRLFDAGW